MQQKIIFAPLFYYVKRPSSGEKAKIKMDKALKRDIKPIEEKVAAQ